MPPAKSRSKSSPANLKSKPPAKASRPASASARTTVSGPARGVAPNGDAATAKAVGTDALAQRFRSTPPSPPSSRMRHATPRQGRRSQPAQPSVTGSTLTESERPRRRPAAAPAGSASTRATARSIACASTPAGRVLTTNQGVPIADNQNSLKAGLRGPDAARGLHPAREDHALRPRAHPRAHRARARLGRARLSSSATSRSTELTRAAPFAEAGKRTPVFVRFSTVAGERGSTDTARDVRGFAVKFYTDEGNWDLVGNNIPVFFIQDAMKFPDLVHAVKPEPHHAHAAGGLGARHVLGLRLADARVDAHADVGDVGPRASRAATA